MNIVRAIARPMLSGIFVYGGLGHFQGLDYHVEAGKPVLDPLRKTIKDATGIDVPAKLFVEAQGAVMTGAGALFALGLFPRLTGTALAATMLPTTFAGHAFWKETDPHAKEAQQIQFFKNLGLAGGALLAAASTKQ